MNQTRNVWWVCANCDELNENALSQKYPVCKTCAAQFDWDDIEHLTYGTVPLDRLAICYTKALYTGDDDTVTRLTRYAQENPKLNSLIAEINATIAGIEDELAEKSSLRL